MSGSVNPMAILLMGTRRLLRLLFRTTYTLTVNSVGSGSVTWNDTGPYSFGDSVPLTAVSCCWLEFQWLEW